MAPTASLCASESGLAIPAIRNCENFISQKAVLSSCSTKRYALGTSGGNSPLAMCPRAKSPMICDERCRLQFSALAMLVCHVLHNPPKHSRLPLSDSRRFGSVLVAEQARPLAAGCRFRGALTSPVWAPSHLLFRIGRLDAKTSRKMGPCKGLEDPPARAPLLTVKPPAAFLSPLNPTMKGESRQKLLISDLLQAFLAPALFRKRSRPWSEKVDPRSVSALDVTLSPLVSPPDHIR